VFSPLFALKGLLYQFEIHKTSENCRTGYPWCLTTSNRISSENIKRKKLWNFLFKLL